MSADDSSLLQDSNMQEMNDETLEPLVFQPLETHFDNSMNEVFFKSLSCASDQSAHQKSASKLVIVSTVLGGTLVMVSLGIAATWGAISVYVASYYREFDPTLTVASASMVYPIQQITSVFLRPITKKMVLLVGYRPLLLIGSSVMSLAFIICSYSESFVVFVICYGLFVGLASGFVGIMPFWSSWEVVPNHKGIVSGLVQTGIALGTLLFTILGQVFANPHNKLPVGLPNNTSEKYYEKDVADNFPRMLFYFGIVSGVLGYIAAFMIKSPMTRSDDGNKTYHHRHQRRVTVQRILATRQFWVMSLMLSFSVTTGIFISSNYKFYGSTVPAINDDTYLTTVGSICSILNAGGKAMWGVLMDKIPFRKIYMFILILQSALTLTLTLASNSRVLFFVWVPLLYLCLGSHYVISPVICSKMYGSERGFEAYGVLASMLSLSSLIQYLVVQLGLQSMGFPNLLYIFASMTIVSLILNIFLFHEKASSKLLKRSVKPSVNADL